MISLYCVHELYVMLRGFNRENHASKVKDFDKVCRCYAHAKVKTQTWTISIV